MKTIVEICCGSYVDCTHAEAGGAHRIELNSALFLGGLTPSMATLKQVKKNTNLEVICMVRPRGAGFCYEREEVENMMLDAQLFLEQGADGIAFGFLDEAFMIDIEKTKQMVQLIHQHHGQAIFHRAFDCVQDPYQAIETLIAIGVDRVLTSGCAETAFEGISLLKELQATYGNQIEILAGCGIHAANAQKILKETGLHQIHSSCKDWQCDVTTNGKNAVSYAYAPLEHADGYEIVSTQKVKALLKAVHS